jgi:hypothetical protein
MVGIPTTDYVHVHFATALACMVMESSLELSITSGRGSNICQHRNLLVHVAKLRGVEFILFLDNDLSFPPYTVDRLVEFAQDKQLDIIGCNYLFKVPPHQFMVVPLGRQEEQVLEGIDEVDRPGHTIGRRPTISCSSHDEPGNRRRHLRGPYGRFGRLHAELRGGASAGFGLVSLAFLFVLAVVLRAI